MPVVFRSSMRGGFNEQIVEGTGFLCRDLDEFTAALHTIVDPYECQCRSEKARDHADRTFSFTRFGHDLRVMLLEVAQTSCEESSIPGCIR